MGEERQLALGWDFIFLNTSNVLLPGFKPRASLWRTSAGFEGQKHWLQYLPWEWLKSCSLAPVHSSLPLNLNIWWLESCKGMVAKDVKLGFVCPHKHLGLKFRKRMSQNLRILIALPKYFRRTKLTLLCWALIFKLQLWTTYLRNEGYF